MKRRGIKYIIFLICYGMPGLGLMAQQIDIQSNFRDAEYYVFEKQYEKALPFYMKLYEADSTNYTINYRIGECYYHIIREQHKAITYLEKAAEKVSRRFVREKYEQNVAHINTHLMLGELYQNNEQLGKAFRNYKKYQTLLRSGEKEEQEKVKQHIKSIYVAWELQQLYVPYSAVSLGDEVNTRHSDYNPVLSANQDVLAYTSFWETTDLIFFTWKEDGKWRKPYNITEMLGSQGEYYTSAMAPDGKTLYLVKQDFVDSDFYYSQYEDDKWHSMKKMSNRINSSSLETSLFISQDGETMLFSSNRSGGQGGLDIYIAHARRKNKWTKPENLGDVINTPYDEEAPFLADNGNLLFFSSKGHLSMGGYDIFYSIKKEDGSWSQPVNVGYPINTSRDDLFYVPFDEGNTGYFVRDLPGGHGLMDIYQVEIPKHLLFKDKLAGFDDKWQSGYYEEVFATYLDKEDAGSSENGDVEMVQVETGLPGTQRIVGSKGEISHVVIPVETNRSDPKSESKQDTLYIDELYNRQQGKGANTTSGKTLDEPQDFIDVSALLAHSEEETETDINTKPDDLQTEEDKVPAENMPKQKQTSKEPIPTPKTADNTGSDKPQKQVETTGINVGSNSIPIYTIQIIALLNPVEAGYFDDIDELTISAGNDGFTRYTVGEYRGYSTARKALKRIREKGYHKAYIRNVKTISNYKKGR